MVNNRLRHSIIFLFTVFLFTLFSCGGTGENSQRQADETSPRITLQFPPNSCPAASSPQIEEVIPRQVLELLDFVVVTVTDSFPTIQETFDIEESIVVFVPFGNDINIMIEGFDELGTPICTGAITLDILGPINDLQIQCVEISEPPPPQLVELDCSDGLDNDEDGAIDCGDTDCFEQPCFAQSGEAGICSSAGICEVPPPPPGVENCLDGVDNNQNDLVDCQDPQCQSQLCLTGGIFGTCRSNQCVPFEICNDGADNDLDSLIDCADPECIGQVGSQEQICEQPEATCNDGADNDGDGLVDCADFDCVGQPGPCEAVCEQPEATCDDFADNDADGQVDCDDSDCAGSDACTETGDECGDESDNDGDGVVDCADPDCDASEPCTETGSTECFNEIDDDGDGDVDCADTDCVGASGGVEGPVCQMSEEFCFDGFDNDGDGAVDCEDSDCFDDPDCFN